MFYTALLPWRRPYVSTTSPIVRIGVAILPVFSREKSEAVLNRRPRKSALWYFAHFVLASLGVLFLSSQAGATTYYVDCNGGSDGNEGTSPAAAWKTLAPVNAKQFAPGDSLLLIMGCTWTGTLQPGGSGTNGNTITINEYGTASTMPHIEGGGATEAVLLSGQQYWDINNLEVSNQASSSGTRRGVRVIATGVSNHIHLVGLNVHNVSGELGTDATSKNTGGIGFESTGGAGASFDDILIQNCTINDTDDIGIYLDADSGTAPRSSNWAQAKWNNVVIEGNQISDIGKNAVVVRSSDTPIIQNNVINGSSTRLHGNAIYTIGTLNAVIQFNEIYNTALTGYSGLEDAAVDPDNDSNGTVIQYNYSHNNAGGMANPNMIPGAGNYCDGTIIRYNISQDDVNQVIQFSGAATNTQIYNNTIYIGSGLSPIIFGAHLWGGTGGWANDTTYSNNIIYNAGTGTYDLGGSTNNVFDANLFYGTHPSSEPSDSKKLTSNPLLQNPGSGGTGINTLDGYQLDSGSPAIASGVVISNNGGRDFFGTTLPNTAPDRGAAQSAAITCSAPSAPAGLTAAATSSSQINLGWNTVQANCPVTYSLFRSTVNGFTPSGSNQIASGLTGTTYSDMSLAASTTYYYLVEGVDSAGASAPSNQASATTGSNGGGGNCAVICIDSGATMGTGSWDADADFTGGGTIDHANTINTSNVTNPAPVSVYQSARDAATGATFSYTIPGLTAGTSYLVRLHFAETFFTTAGSRVFNVSINGTQVLTNFDIVAASGGENIANIQQFTEAANASGQMVITFTSVTNNALISGIEIDSTTPPPPSCTSICIDSGSTTTVTPFVADADFTGGGTIDHANTINLSKVTDPAPEAVYQTARDGATQASGVGAPFTYTIPGFTAASNHTVRLHFAETFFTAANKRVFNVSINGTQVLTNFDIFAAAGGENIANIQQFTVPANASGQYVITFTSVTNNALISGIEVD